MIAKPQMDRHQKGFRCKILSQVKTFERNDKTPATIAHVAYFDRCSRLIVNKTPEELPKQLAHYAEFGPVSLEDNKISGGLPEPHWGSWIPKWLARAIEIGTHPAEIHALSALEKDALTAEFNLNEAKKKP